MGGGVLAPVFHGIGAWVFRDLGNRLLSAAKTTSASSHFNSIRAIRAITTETATSQISLIENDSTGTFSSRTQRVHQAAAIGLVSGHIRQTVSRSKGFAT